MNIFGSAFGNTFLGFKYFAGINALSPYLNDTQRRQMGFSLDEMMLSCIYDLQTCHASDFEWYYDTLYGYSNYKAFIFFTKMDYIILMMGKKKVHVLSLIRAVMPQDTR